MQVAKEEGAVTSGEAGAPWAEACGLACGATATDDGKDVRQTGGF